MNESKLDSFEVVAQNVRELDVAYLYPWVFLLDSELRSDLTPSSYKVPTCDSTADTSSTTRFITARTVRGSIVLSQSRVSTDFRNICK